MRFVPERFIPTSSLAQATHIMFCRSFTVHGPSCSRKPTTANGQPWPYLSALPAFVACIYHMLITPTSLLFGKWDLAGERSRKKRQDS
jgi:hypothetical protein